MLGLARLSGLVRRLAPLSRRPGRTARTQAHLHPLGEGAPQRGEVPLHLLAERLRENHKRFVVPLKLGNIVDRLGADWPRRADTLHRAAHNLIEQRAAAARMFARAGAGYALLFEDVSRGEANRIVRGIAEALERIAFGSPQTAGDQRKAPAPVGRGEPAARRRSPLGRLWRRLFRRATRHEERSAQAAGHDPRRGGEAAHMVSASEARTAATGSERGAAPSGGDRDATPAASAPAPFVLAVPGGDEEPVAVVAVAAAPRAATATSMPSRSPINPRAVVRGAARAGPEAPVAREADPGLEDAVRARVRHAEWARRRQALYRPFPPPGLHFIYKPMWSPRKRLLTTFVCLPAVARSPLELDVGEAVLSEADNVEHHKKLDQLLIAHFVAQLIGGDAAAWRAVVTIPIHVATLRDPSARHAYYEMCALIPPDRRRLVLFEIVDVSRAVGQTQLLTWRPQLRRFGGAVVGQIPLDSGSFAPWRDAGLAAVGCDIAGLDWAESRVIELFAQFVSLARDHGLRTYARGLSTRSLTLAAVAAGFDFIEADPIRHGAYVAPALVEAFALEDLYGAGEP